MLGVVRQPISRSVNQPINRSADQLNEMDDENQALSLAEARLCWNIQFFMSDFHNGNRL